MASLIPHFECVVFFSLRHKNNQINLARCLVNTSANIEGFTSGHLRLAISSLQLKLKTYQCVFISEFISQITLLRLSLCSVKVGEGGLGEEINGKSAGIMVRGEERAMFIHSPIIT